MEEEFQEDQAGENVEAAAPITENQEVESVEEETPRTVPLDALEAERNQRQQLQEEVRMLKEHMNLMQSHSNHTPSKQKKSDEWGDLEEDDILTVKDAKKALNQMNQQYQMTLKEMQMVQKHPDYQEAITKYLPEVIKNNPSLAESLRQSQDYELAYYLATTSEGYRKSKAQANKHADAERIMKNTQKSGSLSSVGSPSPIAQAKNYKDMSDEEFMREFYKHQGY